MRSVSSTGATATQYDRYRWSPNTELYDVLRTFGIGGAVRVLDLSVGKQACAPLADAGATVSAHDPQRAEQLPFGDASFDAAICADAFHLVGDQPAAFGELLRVVRPGGRVVLWWATLPTDCDILGHRAAAAREAGLAPAPDGLSGGFRSFYAAPFSDRAMRVVPMLLETSVEQWIGYERSRADVHNAYGSAAERWYDALERHLVRAYGAPDARLRLRLLQYVYIGTV